MVAYLLVITLQTMANNRKISINMYILQRHLFYTSSQTHSYLMRPSGPVPYHYTLPAPRQVRGGPGFRPVHLLPRPVGDAGVPRPVPGAAHRDQTGSATLPLPRRKTDTRREGATAEDGAVGDWDLGGMGG